MNRPIGLLLRKKRPRSDSGLDGGKIEIVKLSSLEEEIAKLEQQVESTDESDEGSDNDSENNSSQSSVHIEGLVQNPDGLLEYKNGVITSLKPELKIQPLPKSLLPASQCKFADKEKKKKKFKLADALMEASVKSGLAKTIAEQLRHYEPVSHMTEKKPFYCRICKFQAEDMAAFEEHKQSESHVKALDLERKLSSCSLCRKRFTSPDQLKGHLDGKAHKEMLEKVRERRQMESAGGQKFSRY
ncbi:hypothetical protein EON65_34510 [archaeon]|nr:MAG: hypothetical protein EON65_34510 [archaeon]